VKTAGFCKGKPLVNGYSYMKEESTLVGLLIISIDRTIGSFVEHKPT